MTPDFVHLRVHSHYSLADGLLGVETLVQAARAHGMHSVALTELSNLFSAIKFYRAARAVGIKPVLGAEVRVGEAGQEKHGTELVILCADNQGYRNLCKLLTQAELHGRGPGGPVLRREWLEGHTEGLFALSGGRNGAPGQVLLEKGLGAARRELDRWRRLFPERYFLELQRTGREREDEYIEGAVKLAADHEVPLVATNGTCFLKPGDFAAHEARVCIHNGWLLDDTRRPRSYSAQQFLRDAAQMREVFQDLPEALQNTVSLAACCNLELSMEGSHLPEGPVPEGVSQEQHLRTLSKQGLERCLRHPAPGRRTRSQQGYQERLEHELQVISSMGFVGYFLIVADFIGWAKAQGISVGPGRGSGGGSLVAYVLGITDLDPIAHGLFFERFLNPERVSLPDLDIDFCMQRRDEVIQYVTERYGSDRVSQIITYGSMNARAVVRDVGRVLGYTYGFVDQLARLIPGDLNVTLELALRDSERLRVRHEEEEEVRVLIDLARKLEGTPRNAGRHAGGIVIAPRPLCEFMPLYREQASSAAVTQFDMHDIEAIGLVKFDFLGLKTLTTIQLALVTEAEARGAPGPRNPQELPLDDVAVYRLIRESRTMGVFQLESEGIKRLIRRLQPAHFNDLVALVALFRPGPLQSGMVEDFIERRHGRRSISYLCEGLEPILRETYGVILYQEQVMRIARDLAGYSLGEADLLRRAMGKKKPDEMARQRDTFISGATERGGLRPRVAERIFDLMEKFSGYGFNKAHSVGYALIAYWTAWLKARHAAFFFAATLTTDMDNSDRVMRLCGDLRRQGLDLLAPCVNASEYNFRAVDDKTVRYGLGAIRGLGRAAVEGLVAARKAHGSFGDLLDFCRHAGEPRQEDSRRATEVPVKPSTGSASPPNLPASKLNSRALEALVKAGAMDALGANRGALMANLDRAMQAAEQERRDRHSGQSDLFGGDAVAPSPLQPQLSPGEDWPEGERLQAEKEVLGQYLSGHPIRRYEAELSALLTSRLDAVRPGKVVVAGLVERLALRNARGGRLAEIQLDDGTTRMPVILYPKEYERYQELLTKGELLVISGEARSDEYLEGECSIRGAVVWTLEAVRNKAACLRLLLKETAAPLEGLRDILQPARRPGAVSVEIDYQRAGAGGLLRLGANWRVKISEDLLLRLRLLLGEEAVWLRHEHGLIRRK